MSYFCFCFSFISIYRGGTKGVVDRHNSLSYNFRNLGNFHLYINSEFIKPPGGYLYKVPVPICG
nr:MAG TPA: hypothetical protein [Caudoviricetes sp.]